MQTVLAHELCHVRYRDNLTAAIHMFVETVFWFHPMVWWMEKRMVEERERACDEEVLLQGSDPRVYAEGILNVCKLYAESPLACVSGVSGSNLGKRIAMILSNRTVVRVGFAKKGILTLAAAIALVLPITLGIMTPRAIRGQSASRTNSAPVAAPQPKQIAFEVASVKVSRSNDPGGNIDFEKDGRLVARNVPLKALIAEAYHVRSDSLSGAAGWTESERFDIIAKASPSTPPDDLRRMMVTLLRERFQLTTHTEQKVMPAFALVKGNNPQSLKPSEAARAVDGGCGPVRPETRGDIAVSCQHMSMADLADALPDIGVGIHPGARRRPDWNRGFLRFPVELDAREKPEWR